MIIAIGATIISEPSLSGGSPLPSASRLSAGSCRKSGIRQKMSRHVDQTIVG